MDTKKYMTFHAMEEQVATFRIKRLRFWTLWREDERTSSRTLSSKSTEETTVQLTMQETLSIPPLLNMKLWVRAIRAHAKDADTTVLRFLRETYNDYKVRVGLVAQDSADEHASLIDEYLDAIIQSVVQGAENEYDILELSEALKASDMPIEDLVHRVQFHLARTGRESQALGLDEEEVMHYINSQYNEAVVTDDEESDAECDDGTASPSAAAAEPAAEQDPTSQAVQQLRHQMEQAEASLQKFEAARVIAEKAKASEAVGAPKPRLLSVLLQARLAGAAGTLEGSDEDGVWGEAAEAETGPMARV
jgi:hypothetical protein